MKIGRACSFVYLSALNCSKELKLEAAKAKSTRNKSDIELAYKCGCKINIKDVMNLEL